MTPFERALMEMWQNDPDSLEAAMASNPEAFGQKAVEPFNALSQTIKGNYDNYQQLSSNVQNKSTLQGALAGEDFAYVPGGRREGVLTGGAYLPDKANTASSSSWNAIQNSGLPLYKDIDGKRYYLNTGFGYVDGDYVVNPGKDAAIGEYSVAGQKRSGDGWKPVAALAASLVNPALGAALGAASGPKEGGGFGDVARPFYDFASDLYGRQQETRGPGQTRNEQGDPDLPPDVEYGPDGPPEFNLPPGSIFDYGRPWWEKDDPPKPVEAPKPDQSTGGGGGGNPSGGSPSAPGGGSPGNSPAEPVTDPDPFKLGDYIGNGKMRTNDGRIVDAPPGNWQTGQPVYEHGEPADPSDDGPLGMWGLEDLYGILGSGSSPSPSTGNVATNPSAGNTGTGSNSPGTGSTGGDPGTGQGGTGGGTGGGSGTGDGPGDGPGSGEGEGGEGNGLGGAGLSALLGMLGLRAGESEKMGVADIGNPYDFESIFKDSEQELRFGRKPERVDLSDDQMDQLLEMLENSGRNPQDALAELLAILEGVKS